MGYTHYLYQEKGPIPQGAWLAFRRDVQRLIDAAPCQLAFEGSSPGKKPLVSAQMVRFNGVPGYETFLVERAPRRTFSFTKTAQQPYDQVVVAALACLAEHAPEHVRVQSDGEPADWQPGVTWASQVLGREIRVPTTVKDEEHLT